MYLTNFVFCYIIYVICFQENLVESKHHKLARSLRTGPTDRDLKPNAATRDQLNVRLSFHQLFTLILLREQPYDIYGGGQNNWQKKKFASDILLKKSLFLNMLIIEKKKVCFTGMPKKKSLLLG